MSQFGGVIPQAEWNALYKKAQKVSPSELSSRNAPPHIAWRLKKQLRSGGGGGGGKRERRQWEVESDTLPTTFDQLYNVMGLNRLELKNHKAIISGFQ